MVSHVVAECWGKHTRPECALRCIMAASGICIWCVVDRLCKCLNENLAKRGEQFVRRHRATKESL